MSADNWTMCPKCVDTQDHALLKAKTTIEASYGKVPAADYLKAMRNLDSTPAPRKTLREDYEIGMCEGSLVIDYRASCTECKFVHSFKSDVRVYPPAVK